MRGTSQARIASPHDAEVIGIDEDPGRQYVVALARGLGVLKAIASAGRSLGNQELSDLTGLTKPTVSRLTFTLTRLGYLVCSPTTGRYTLGTAALALGYWTMASTYIRQIAKPLMDDVSRELNLCCALGYRDDLEAVYLEHSRGPGALFMNMQPGSRNPITTTALGRALIAVMDSEDQNQFLANAERLYAGNWEAVKRGINASLDAYKRHGFTISVGDWEPEISAVGVPLILHDGQPPMALVLGGASYSLDSERLLNEIGPRLIKLAQDITGKLKPPQLN
jgi:DNA-binding IclR family transcriptional regulator